MVDGQRVAVVTGASSGIGLEAAKALVSSGWRVIAIGRDFARCASAEAQIRSSAAGAELTMLQADLALMSAATALADEITELTDRIDVLINNAGTNRRGQMADISARDYQTVMQVNVDGLFLTTRAVSVHMQKRKAGKIINICSALSKMGRKGAVAYSGYKAAAAMMTASMCDELAGDNIQVNGIAPG